MNKHGKLAREYLAGKRALDSFNNCGTIACSIVDLQDEINRLERKMQKGYTKDDKMRLDDLRTQLNKMNQKGSEVFLDTVKAFSVTNSVNAKEE